jgi:hypothetical protein
MNMNMCARLMTTAAEPVMLEGVKVTGDLKGLLFEAIFWFRRSQMESALEEYFNALRKLDATKRGRVEWPIYGQSMSKILQLESSIPSKSR